MTDVFVSYARSTYPQARQVADALIADGYKVWIDDDLPAHRVFSTVIEERLNEAKAVLVLWSEDARASRWVPAEADLAFNADKLVQMSIDGVLPPLPFNRVHCEMAAGWNGETDVPQWRKVTASIAALTGTKGAANPRLAGTLPTTGWVMPEQSDPLLAILPFDNLSSDEELTYFCDGVSEEIQRTVSDGSSLRVVARSSSFQFRGSNKDAAHVSSALGASHLLDGSVRRGGQRLRISAELVECRSLRVLWGDRFDGDYDDVFALQERIAEQVANALKVALARQAGETTLPNELYEKFLRARGKLAEGDATFDDSAERAIPQLEEVTEAAPDFAPAWEILATARAAALRSGHFKGDYATRREDVLEAAHTALRLDPRRGGAYLALALLEPWGAYRQREKLLLKALELSPNDPSTLTEISDFYWSVGRFRDALSMAQKACELNPLMPAARLHVAQMHAYIGDYAGCISMTRDLMRRWPDNAGILLSLLNTAGTLGFWEAHDEAVREIDRFEGWQANDMRAARAFHHARRTMDPELIERRIGRYKELLEETGTMPLNIVVSIAAFNRVDLALDLAEKASYDYIFDPKGDRPSLYYPGTILGPWSDAMKQPRFAKLCVRLGLSQYWIETGAWPDCVEWTPYDFKAEVQRAHEEAQAAG